MELTCDLRWRRRGGWAGLAWLAVVLLAAAGCGQDDSPGAQRVVVYCSVDQPTAERVLAEFSKRTGVKVLARYDAEASKTVGLVQRLRAERKAPAADVFWSGEVFHTIRLAREGLLSPYRSDATADWPKQFTGPQGRWRAFALRGRVIVYNTTRLSAQTAPKKLEDLLAEQWRGRIVMARPQAGTTGGDVASWFAHYGRRRAREILEGLKANGVRLVDGNSLVVRQVAGGQADVGLTDTDDVHAGLRNGWPVAMHPLDQGGAGSLAIPNTVALVAGAPHGRQARMLVDFLLSEQVEVMLAESDLHTAPIRPALAEKFAAYSITHPLAVDYGRIADELPLAIRTAGEVFR